MGSVTNPNIERLARRLAAAYYSHPVSAEAWEKLGRMGRERWMRVAIAAQGPAKSDPTADLRREWMVAA